MSNQTSIPCPETQYVYDKGIDHVLQRQQLKDSLKSMSSSTKLGFKKAEDFVRFKSKLIKDMALIESKKQLENQTSLF